jgi:cysteine synthase A
VSDAAERVGRDESTCKRLGDAELSALHARDLSPHDAGVRWGAPASHESLTGRQSRLLTEARRLGNLFRPTPLVRIWDKPFTLFAKTESRNPFGSIKDRTAYGILLGAIERGEVDPDTTIIESSSGNFALAMASLCRLLDLEFVPVIDPLISPLYRAQLNILCQRVEVVNERDAAGGYLGTRLARVRELLGTFRRSYWPDQYTNLDGAEMHYRLTGAELCDAVQRLDYVFVPVSSFGTVVGVSRIVKERFPSSKIVAVDSEGSKIFGGSAKARYIPGLGSSIRPGLLRHARIDRVIHVDEAFVAPACRL